MRSVAWTARIVLTVLIGVTASCSEGSEREDSRPTVSVPTDAPSATVHKTQEQACAEVDQGRVQEVDQQDLAELKSRLEHEPRIRMIATTVCGRTPAISVGVATFDAEVPRVGRAGTPIIVFRQRPIYAF